MDAQSLYVQLGRLVETMPDLTTEEVSAEAFQWLGRAHALVSISGDVVDVAKLKVATDRLGPGYYRWSAAREITAIVHRALAVAELRAPASTQGAFVPAGSTFDAMAAIAKIFSAATNDVLVVDPYMDAKVLTDFAPLAPEKASLRLVSDFHSHKPTLRPAAERWAQQYGPRRPLEVRLAPARTLHDRLLIVDDTQVWILTQSLNAFAARAPASIVRADGDAATLKVAAYRDIWNLASPL